MGISQPQNLKAPVAARPGPYGIRVSLLPGDPFSKLVGPQWHRLHWYPSAAQRDEALDEMSRRHLYSRAGDKPALQFERVENLVESRGV
jgi:hypothetical protein